MTRAEALTVISSLHRQWKASGTRQEFTEFCTQRGYDEAKLAKLIILTEEQ
jgi:hypothetical protein